MAPPDRQGGSLQSRRGRGLRRMVGRFLDGASDQDTVLDREAAAEVGSPQLARLGAWLVAECRALLDPAYSDRTPPADFADAQAGSGRAGMRGRNSRRVLPSAEGSFESVPSSRSPSPIRNLRRVDSHGSSTRSLLGVVPRSEATGGGWRQPLNAKQRFDYFSRKVQEAMGCGINQQIERLSEVDAEAYVLMSSITVVNVRYADSRTYSVHQPI